MAAPELTHAQFLAMLVADGCLPIVKGKLPTKMPVEAVVLDHAHREKLEIPPGALAVFYPVGETGVFMQMHGSHARIWYTGIDTDGALATFESELHRAHPSAVFVEQGPHPEVPGSNVRVYRLDIDPTHFVEIEATYPIDRRVNQQFIVRLHGRQRV